MLCVCCIYIYIHTHTTNSTLYIYCLRHKLYKYLRQKFGCTCVYVFACVCMCTCVLIQIFLFYIQQKTLLHSDAWQFGVLPKFIQKHPVFKKHVTTYKTPEFSIPKSCEGTIQIYTDCERKQFCCLFAFWDNGIWRHTYSNKQLIWCCYSKRVI